MTDALGKLIHRTEAGPANLRLLNDAQLLKLLKSFATVFPKPNAIAIGMAGAREPGPLQPHLAEIRCPVVLLLGGVPHPGAPPAAEVSELQQGLRVFAIDSLPGVGHFAYEERPAAVVAAVDRVRRTAPAP